MTAAELNLVIKAKDQSKKAFTSLKGRVSKSYAQLGKFTKFARERFKALGSGLATFAKRGAIALAAFAAATGYAFVKALRSTIDFEMQMAKVSTMLDKNSRKLLPEFKRAISGMAMEFGEATGSLTDGAYDILSAMVAPKEAMKVLRTGANAAIAGFTDTKTSISALLTAMKAYGIKTSKVTEIADKFLTVQERGRTTLSEMAPVFGRLAAMSASAGGSFDETAAAMATVTRAGLPTVLAITGLSAAYRTFLISSDDAKAAAKRAGFELTQQWLKTNSLREALERIHNTRQVELKDVFATSEAILAAGLLMKNLGGFTKDTTAITEDFSGATKRAADKIKSKLGFQLKRLKSGFIEVGKAMTEKFGDKLKPLVDEFNKSMPEIKKVFGELGDILAKKLGPHMKDFLEYIKGLTKEKVVEKFKNIKEAFKLMVPYIQGAAYAMMGLFVATHLVAAKLALILAGYKLIWEIGQKIGGAGSWLAGKGFGASAKIMETILKLQKKTGVSQKEINELTRMANQARKAELEWEEGGVKLMKDKAIVIDTIVKALKGELSVGGEIKAAIDEAKEGFKSQLEPLKAGLSTVDKQAGQEKNINALLESRKKILDSLQKARAKVPTADIRYTTAKGGVEEVVSKEYPSGIPVEKFDKTVAEAKAQNQALDDLGKATEGMLGDLIQNFNDGKIGIDKLVSGIAGYVNTANNLGIAEKAAFTQIFSLLKGLTSKTNSLSKAFNAQALKTKQLQGQLAGA